MKIELRKKPRIILFSILSILILVTATFAYYQKDKVNSKEVDETVLSYTLTPEINSQFYLKENPIYKDIFLEDTEVIINQLLNHIYSEIEINLEAEDADFTELQITHYEKLETYFGEEDHVLWQRITEPTTESLMGTTQITYTHKNEFKPSVFTSFLDYAYETLEMRPKALIQILWEVKGIVVKGDKKMEVDQVYTLPIPVYDDMFVIDKEALLPYSDELVETFTIETPTNPLIFKGLVGASGLFLLLLLLSVLLIKKAPDKTTYEKLRNQIFNDFNDRLAELEQNIYNGLSNLITVVKIEDLVKISDEIRQPIFYFERDKAEERQMEFFVFDESRIYHVVYYDEIEMTVESFIQEAV